MSVTYLHVLRPMELIIVRSSAHESLPRPAHKAISISSVIFCEAVLQKLGLKVALVVVHELNRKLGLLSGPECVSRSGT